MVKESDKSSAEKFLEKVILPVNERILQSLHELYFNGPLALNTIADAVFVELIPPRRKISVLLLGNHSAGKSTFINWYIDEHVQRTGVAVETQGFTVVTSGRRKESLKGNMTLKLYPHLKQLVEIPGVIDYLSTEISTSVKRDFPLATLIDSPGLVDGDMKYPFDVNEAVIFFGCHADLILVFFDPIGQALTKRTLDIVEKLSEHSPEKIKYCLSKADESGSEIDRQKVLMQVVQEVCRRPVLNRAGFDMPAIYIPDETVSRKTTCVNQINSVVQEIRKCIDHNIQNALQTFEEHCDILIDRIDNSLGSDDAGRQYNSSCRCIWILFGLVYYVILVVSLVVLVSVMVPENILKKVVVLAGDNFYLILHDFVIEPCNTLVDKLPDEYNVVVGVLLILTLLVCYIASKCASRSIQPTQDRKGRIMLEKAKLALQNDIKNRKTELSEMYLHQSTSNEST